MGRNKQPAVNASLRNLLIKAAEAFFSEKSLDNIFENVDCGGDVKDAKAGFFVNELQKHNLWSEFVNSRFDAGNSGEGKELGKYLLQAYQAFRSGTYLTIPRAQAFCNEKFFKTKDKKFQRFRDEIFEKKREIKEVVNFSAYKDYNRRKNNKTTSEAAKGFAIKLLERERLLEEFRIAFCSAAQQEWETKRSDWLSDYEAYENFTKR